MIADQGLVIIGVCHTRGAEKMAQVAEEKGIAVANTPGLAGSLLVGLVAAKTLCLALNLPLLAVNHVHAHIYACRLNANREVFPCVGLVVSGGHSLLMDCPAPTDFRVLGGTHRRVCHGFAHCDLTSSLAT